MWALFVELLRCHMREPAQRHQQLWVVRAQVRGTKSLLRQGCLRNAPVQHHLRSRRVVLQPNLLRRGRYLLHAARWPKRDDLHQAE